MDKVSSWEEREFVDIGIVVSRTLFLVLRIAPGGLVGVDIVFEEGGVSLTGDSFVRGVAFDGFDVAII
jgi:hypothetical protein